MIRSFKRMKEGCNPSIFYNYIRPFLAGSKGNPSMPDGVIYDGVFDNKPQMFSGGSAAQKEIETDEQETGLHRLQIHHQ